MKKTITQKEIEELKRWKKEGIIVLTRWNKLTELFNDKLQPGNTISTKIYELIEELQEENIQLKDDVNKLDQGLHEHKNPHWKMFQDIQNHLKKENIDLKSKLADVTKKYDEQRVFTDTNARIALRFKEELASIKTLNRGKVWDCFEYEFAPILNNQKITTDNINNVVHAICKLAVPQIDKDIVIKALLENSTVEEIELKNGNKVSYRVLGQAGFEVAANQILKTRKE